jgi:hypothetical protein
VKRSAHAAYSDVLASVLFWTAHGFTQVYDFSMANITLKKFIEANREELIRRCRAKVAGRSAPLPTVAEIDHGVPLFLSQLVDELSDGPSKTQAISTTAVKHGHDLLVRGFTISQVVHGYGDVCQSITDLAVETEAPISTEDFRTLNRCLDDAIAGAVTEYSRAQELNREGDSVELRNLTDTALTAFEALQTGKVGIGGSTGAVVHRSLSAMRTFFERPLAETAHPKSQ